jgi:PAB-dependent poly(A)-specific ribonuclease subunit 3
MTFFNLFYIIRIRISSCGIIDILMHDTPQDVHTLQQEDLLMFGQVVFALCCNNVAASIPQHLQTSLETIGRIYSMDVKNVALFLIGHTRQRVCGFLSSGFLVDG